MKRSRIEISGLVQGVGFRPFVLRVATTHHLGGFVRNSLQGVTIEVEGSAANIAEFKKDIADKKPSAAVIKAIAFFELPPTGERVFQIEASKTNGVATAAMPHDRAPCDKCLQEFNNPSDRRFRYPFVTCDDCGPRFTITEALPFDRERTSMRHFQLCAECHAEFSDPHDRRFHAQTISCPLCGPTLSFSAFSGDCHYGEGAWRAATALLRQGGLIAVKGIGGYQLICSALAAQSIARIRNFKARQRKPFAVMAPNAAEAAALCHSTPAERALLNSPIAPVVLLYGKNEAMLQSSIHPQVAPGLPTLGVMLPASPLHHLLIEGAQSWLVVTSANYRGEPMYTDDGEALSSLEGIVDGILCHNRPIAHLADDSVLRMGGESTIVLRHARGLAPTELPTASAFSQGEPYRLGVGGHTKAAFALQVNSRLILSQHIGDLDSQRSRALFQREVEAFEKLYACSSQTRLICRDYHPAYGSTAIAEAQGGTIQAIYHHEAHLESLIAEHGHQERALGVVGDGSGLGLHHALWGGEFFLITGNERERIGSLRPFRLPGGEKAIKEPRRCAYGLLAEVFAEATPQHPFVRAQFTSMEHKLLAAAMKQDLNTPFTTSLGRLFDGLAALLGICSIADYEAEAAMAMEALAHQSDSYEPFPVIWEQDAAGFWQWDWRNLVTLAYEARDREVRQKRFAAAFHATIVQAMYELAHHCHATSILVSGGVFQNAVLVNLCHTMLSAAGVVVKTHQRIPPGDGGLALGQIAAAYRREHVLRHSR